MDRSLFERLAMVRRMGGVMLILPFDLAGSPLEPDPRLAPCPGPHIACLPSALPPALPPLLPLATIVRTVSVKIIAVKLFYAVDLYKESVLLQPLPLLLPAQAGVPVKLLSVQYRMHKDIREFPSNFFYDGQLQDAPQVGLINKCTLRPTNLYQDTRHLK